MKTTQLMPENGKYDDRCPECGESQIAKGTYICGYSGFYNEINILVEETPCHSHQETVTRR